MALATVSAGGAGIKRSYATTLDSLTSDVKEPLGVIRREGNKTYKYVQFHHSGVDLAAGDVVSYNDYDTSDVTGDHSDGDNVGAGVTQAAVTSAEDNYYGWIQVRGQAPIETDVTAGANGNALTVVGAGDKTLDVSALVTDHVCAVLLDSTANAQIILCLFPH